jgi:hypothetical protein
MKFHDFLFSARTQLFGKKNINGGFVNPRGEKWPFFDGLWIINEVPHTFFYKKTFYKENEPEIQARVFRNFEKY